MCHPMDYNVKKDIETRLMQIKTARRVSKDEIVMRCMFCGDSKKDPNKTRLYFKLNPNTDEPIFYHCFNCQESGILTPSVLRSMGINDLELNSNLIRHNKSSNSQNKKSKQTATLKFKVPIPEDNKLNKLKKEYICNRLGIDLSYDELSKLKAVFSLEQFLDFNNIANITTSPAKANLLNNDYVGFLSSKNEMITYRDITDKNQRRYDKYMILGNMDTYKKFYTIPTSIDIMSSKSISLNIAEGVFDILGVYFHVNDENTNNQVYSAVNGSGYMSVIKYFIELGFIGNIKVNIFSDSDKSPYFYKNIIDEISPWVKSVHLYYNMKSKDFGVPKKYIELTKKC